MATIIVGTYYRCSDDCVMSGCPGHVGRLAYQSTSDAYSFDMNGRSLSFERGELDAMLALLTQIDRVDCVQIPPDLIAPPSAPAAVEALPEKWRKKWADGYMTGDPVIDATTNAYVSAAEQLAGELEAALAKPGAG